ncbi:uncharacterized protein EI90DRAFT_3144359 [Cantharellus anzutake]|uniref:uncharacterized protein n=1 Tax=Cantharellus anzutake TaxID=1750568 RepID=UPI001903E343|nr:uncharacterized protein EI90DRAFT_3144359 [Cantharellus anzutake]KAF8338026.1 hypothetical protein EI90DRAFT_3144359 [Cantharellus anzutake]
MALHPEKVAVSAGASASVEAHASLRDGKARRKVVENQRHTFPLRRHTRHAVILLRATAVVTGADNMAGLDIYLKNPASKQENAHRRRSKAADDAVWKVVSLHKEAVELRRSLDDKRQERSRIGYQFGHDLSTLDKSIKYAKTLKDVIHSLEARVAAIDAELFATANSLPNDTHPSTPIGPESQSLIISAHGPPPMDPSTSRDHMRIACAFDWVDFESGASVTGSSWYYLRNECALLELALINYAISVAVRAGFSPVTVPDVVKSDIADRCGFHPRDQDGVSQNYHLGQQGSEPPLVLSGTAEIPLAGMFAQRIFKEKELPLRIVGLGHAFRAEAGARGADTRGLYRVHQFTKVELFAVTREEESEDMMNEMINVQRRIFEGLNLPFRVLEMPSEELGSSAYRKCDMEAWMPGRGSWGEISSTSNCTDYQARRLHILHKPAKPNDSPPSPLPFAHTLNGTAAAIPRLIIALLENNVRFGSHGEIVGVDLPRCLLPFWIGDVGDRVDFV